MLPVVPRSDLGNSYYGTGNFALSILVTEHDDYGEKIKELGQTVEEKKGGWVSQISGFLN